MEEGGRGEEHVFFHSALEKESVQMGPKVINGYEWGATLGRGK